MDDFKKVAERKTAPIKEKIDKAAADLAKRNREVITSLMRCMLLSVERGFAVRGHRDAGIPVHSEELTSEDEYINLGNFKSIVRTMAVTDKNLKAKLSEGNNYANYVSPRTQVEMLQCILDCLQAEIINEARSQKGKFIYAVSVDEVSDVSITEQLAVVIRTVNEQGHVKERLLEYIELESIRGKAVSEAVVDCLTKHGLELSGIRAQTYDGAANLSGHLNGCQAHIQRLEPLAEYFHCASHKLNLCLNSTTKLQEFRIKVDNVKQLGIFYHFSPKTTGNLKELLKKDASIQVTKVIILV